MDAQMGLKVFENKMVSQCGSIKKSRTLESNLHIITITVTGI